MAEVGDDAVTVDPAWVENNLCGICPYRKAIQARNDELTTALFEALAIARAQRDLLDRMLTYYDYNWAERARNVLQTPLPEAP